MKTAFIYALCEPETREARYIGKANDPQIRLVRDHLGAARQGKRTHLYNWIRELLRHNRVPELVVLFGVEESEWQLWERKTIEFFKREGCALINQTPGGEGGPICRGRKQSPEHIANLSAARTGQKRTLEQCARISAGKQGRKLGPQSCEHLANRSAAVSAAKKGRPWTEKQREIMAVSRARKKAEREAS